jgi:cytochrome c biogenesis protein ResB
MILSSVSKPDNNDLPSAAGNGRFTILRKINSFMSSAKLAMFLLIAILGSCIAGVTILRGRQAWEIIFGSLWFNGLMILLVLNVGFCFFNRIWGRKLTLISFGMILFHLSFVSMFTGIVYNSLFFFQGVIRLTEGETLPNADLRSYDYTDQGRFFNVSRLNGKTTLVKMFTNYNVEGSNKRAAYEISVGEDGSRKTGVIFITNNFDYRGFKYLPDKEGYSLLIMLYDPYGRELYGAHVPLQSLKQKGNSYLYTTGTKDGPTRFHFPDDAENPLFDLQVAYRPSSLKERSGDAIFQVWRHNTMKAEEKPFEQSISPIGKRFKAGIYYLSAKEVRYWVGMNVRYDPGKPIVLTSLWVGLSGMIITTIGRIRQGRKRKECC